MRKLKVQETLTLLSKPRTTCNQRWMPCAGVSLACTLGLKIDQSTMKIDRRQEEAGRPGGVRALPNRCSTKRVILNHLLPGKQWSWTSHSCGRTMARHRSPMLAHFMAAQEEEVSVEMRL